MRRLNLATGIILALAVSRAGFPAPAESGALVSIPKGASQQEALEELHRATGLLVLAEPTQVEHTCDDPIQDARPDAAIAAITAAYQLHALVGKNRVLFVRRFRDPREVPDLPVEELASITVGLRDLIDPFSSHLDTPTPVQDAFYASLSGPQLAAAQAGKLRLGDLTQQQQAMWRPLQANLLFDRQANELRFFAALYQNWRAANFEWEPNFGPGGNTHDLLLRWPLETGFHAHMIYQEGSRRTVPKGPVPPEESVEPFAAPGASITKCGGEAGAFAQPVKLEDLAVRLGTQNGVTIQVPKWAGNRECLLFAAGHTGDELLQSVAELNGWVIHASGPQRFALQRPMFPPAVDYPDYYRKARALVPPSMIGMAHGRFVRDDSTAERRGLQAPLVAQRVLKAKPGYKPLNVQALETEWQRRIASMLFADRLLSFIGYDLSGNGPETWLAAPERCVFVLRGQVGLGKHPTLLFGYDYIAPGGESRFQGAGWVVGSHDLFPKGE